MTTALWTGLLCLVGIIVCVLCRYLTSSACLHEQSTDAPNYLFDKSRIGCWAAVVKSSVSDRWTTPRDVYRALDDEFCFDFDPFPLDGTEDGLATLYARWAGRRVFCNPPYGPGLAKWLERGLEANLAVFLIPARTDTRWFHDIVLPKAKEIRFIKGRLKFGDAVNAAPFPSMIVVFKQ